MENHVYDVFYAAFKPVVSPHQHGFLKGRSTFSNLFTFVNIISSNLNEHNQIDVNFTDLSKAFDLLNHDVILRKLESLDISQNYICLLRSYLSLCVNVVSLAGFDSEPFRSDSGMPQGSNLGPFLFIITLNDVDRNLTCFVLIYADDIKIFLPIDY